MTTTSMTINQVDKVDDLLQNQIAFPNKGFEYVVNLAYKPNPENVKVLYIQRKNNEIYAIGTNGLEYQITGNTKYTFTEHRI